MNGNQFAVYQLKASRENREIRFLAYRELEKKGIEVRCENYDQAYLGMMQPGDTPAGIRLRLERKLPRNFKGHSIGTGDVIVMNQAGKVTSWYVEKEGFTEIRGFFSSGPSGGGISIETKHLEVEGKAGKWLVYDSILLDGREFFLLEHETYGAAAANIVVDEHGKLVVDQVFHGFDEAVKRQIRESVRLPAARSSPKESPEKIEKKTVKPRRIGNRISVLDRLHLKQAEIAKRGRTSPEAVSSLPSGTQEKR